MSLWVYGFLSLQDVKLLYSGVVGFSCVYKQRGGCKEETKIAVKR